MPAVPGAPPSVRWSALAGLLPWHVSTMGALVSGQAHREQCRMDSAMGFDLRPFNRFSPLELNAGKGGGQDIEWLSEPQELIGFDLRHDQPHKGEQPLRLRVSHAGSAEALMRWLRLDFGDGIVFENRPPQRSSWDPQLHVLPKPCEVRPGDELSLQVAHEHTRLYVFPPEPEVGA